MATGPYHLSYQYWGASRVTGKTLTVASSIVKNPRSSLPVVTSIGPGSGTDVFGRQRGDRLPDVLFSICHLSFVVCHSGPHLVAVIFEVLTATFLRKLSTRVA